MMQYLKQAMDLAKELKKGEITPQELAEKLKASIPAEFLPLIKKETPESIIEKIEPLVSSFMGKEAVELLKSESTVKLLEQALDLLKD